MDRFIEFVQNDFLMKLKDAIHHELIDMLILYRITQIMNRNLKGCTYLTTYNGSYLSVIFVALFIF